MAKNFDFSGGTKSDHGALAAVLAAGIQAATDAARLRSQAAQAALQGGSETLQRAVELISQQSYGRSAQKADIDAMAKRQQQGQEFQSSERRASEAFTVEERRKEREADIAAQARLFEQQRALGLQDVLATLGATGIREQGLDAPELMQLFEQKGGSNAFEQTFAPGPGIPPGGPGGFMIGQEGYKGLVKEKPQGFAGVKRHPPPMTWEERKFHLTEEEKQRVSATALQIRRLQATGDKNVVVDEETSLQEALGFGELDDAELEAAVLRAYPNLTPKVSLDGEEGDRKALDAKIKLLQKKQKVSVPNGPGLTGLEWSSAANDPAVIHAAMEEVFGEKYEIPMNEADMRAAASKKLLERYPEYVNRFQPAQVQGSLGDVLGQAKEQELVQGAGAEEQPGVWSKDLLEASGLALDRLSPGLRDAALARMPIEAGPDGRLMFVPRQDGTPPAANWQAELDQVQQIPGVRERLGVILGAGPVKQTPSDVKDKALLKGAKASAPPRSEPAGSKTGGGKQPDRERSGGSSSPGASALEAYRQSKMKSEPKKVPAKMKVPPKASLIGLPPETLLELLLGGAQGLR